MKKKLIRITTVPISLEKLLEGQLEFMNDFYDVVAVSSNEKELKILGEKQNIRVFPIEMTRKITPFQDIKALFNLYKFLKKEQPFIVHTHTPKAGIVGMLAAKFAGVPNRLHTVAGMPLLEAVGMKRNLLNFVERITYSCATKVYPNSIGLKKIILECKFADKEKLKVIGNGSSNGINTEKFSKDAISVLERNVLKEKSQIKEDDFVFIFVGRLVADKGINELVRAFEMIYKSHKNVKLLLVGNFEPDLDPLLPAIIDSIKKHPSIIEVGYQNDVRPYFAIANVLVFPSYREGFPNVVMQAGAMGLPSIVTNINGCNEIIIEGENGWIIPVKNSKSIEKAMKSCLVKEDSFIFAKKNARRMIKDRYQQNQVWETILKEYRILEKKCIENISKQ